MRRRRARFAGLALMTLSLGATVDLAQTTDPGSVPRSRLRCTTVEGELVPADDKRGLPAGMTGAWRSDDGKSYEKGGSFFCLTSESGNVRLNRFPYTQRRMADFGKVVHVGDSVYLIVQPLNRNAWCADIFRVRVEGEKLSWGFVDPTSLRAALERSGAPHSVSQSGLNVGAADLLELLREHPPATLEQTYVRAKGSDARCP